MAQFDLEDVTSEFLLCATCDQITGAHFSKCHHCKKQIDKYQYTHYQTYTPDLYKELATKLLTLKQRKDMPSNMISINVDGDASVAPELWQVIQLENETTKKISYRFYHYQRDTHQKLCFDIDPMSYVFALPSFINFQMELVYGDSPVYLSL